MSRKRKAADVYPFLEAYVAKREEMIQEIEQVVERYEKRRMMEDRAYQAMSQFRRILSGKKPDHHLAVEYIHYVKKPMEQVRRLRKEIETVRKILNDSLPTDIITLPDEIDNELA